LPLEFFTISLPTLIGSLHSTHFPLNLAFKVIVLQTFVALKKLNLPNSFTLKKNGGLKTVFFNEGKSYGLIASQKDDCFYGSIVSLENNVEVIYDFKCLPDKKTDFNAIGSSSIHTNGKKVCN
jgi:hypothetical protein